MSNTSVQLLTDSISFAVDQKIYFPAIVKLKTGSNVINSTNYIIPCLVMEVGCFRHGVDNTRVHLKQTSEHHFSRKPAVSPLYQG